MLKKELTVDSIHFILRRVQRNTTKKLRYDDHPFVSMQVAILILLFREERPLTVSEIVERINNQKSTIIQMLQGLQTLGYVKKENGKNDRRLILVRLTDKAHDEKAYFDQLLDESISEMFAGFSQSEATEFLQYLERVERNLRE